MISARNYKSQVAVLAAALLMMLPAAFAGSNDTGAYLGVHISDLTPELVSSLRLNDITGVVVQSIDHDGPACKAGIRNNDVIVSVAGTPVRNIQEMVAVMNNMAAGSVANIAIVRDGSPQNVKVTLGNRKNWMAATPAPMPNSAMAKAGPVAKGFVAPMPPVAYPADVDVPLMTPASARRGIVVEGLSTQLAEFFGVPNGQGVLVRNVQRGSWGANAGLKAGDVIVKIDGQAIRDLADWRRSMNIINGKTSFSIIREKHEQVVEMAVPTSGELRLGEDWDSFEPDMSAFNRQMELSRPEIEKQTEAMMFSNDELEKMQRDVEKSVAKGMHKELKHETKELKHQTKELQKSMKQLEPELRKQTQEIQKQMELMRPEIEKQTQAAREQMERMGPEFQKQIEEAQKSMAVLKDQDLEKMRHQIEDSMKTITPQIQEQMKLIGPQIQQQMQELQKQMQQNQHDWQEMMKNWPSSSDRPNEM
jgi:membrane-associated protease RseP (regulator of RpoE activity)